MGFYCDSEYRHSEGYCHETKKPFVHSMDNGCIFRIDRISVRFHPELVQLLHSKYRFEVKFCVTDDEELPGSENIEQWELVFFPMYVKDEEIPHDSVIPHGESVVNGNVVIEDGKVVESSSNYCDPDYEALQNPIVEYTQDYLQRVIAKHT